MYLSNKINTCIGHICENVSCSPGLLPAENIRKLTIEFHYIYHHWYGFVRSDYLWVFQRFLLFGIFAFITGWRNIRGLLLRTLSVLWNTDANNPCQKQIKNLKQNIFSSTVHNTKQQNRMIVLRAHYVFWGGRGRGQLHYDTQASNTEQSGSTNPCCNKGGEPLLP